MHEDLSMNHSTIPISEYRLKAQQLTPRFCTVHKNTEYSMACRSCLTVVCAECLAEESSCTDGRSLLDILFYMKFQ